MSVRSFLEFIENKADVLQDYVTTRSHINTMFGAGAACIAFGVAAGVPDFRDVGIMLLAGPSTVSGTCMIAKATARAAKQFAPQP